ncbi:unnamed protein product [Clonostachys rosea f. rosea IK726]|uniref:MARVEL domain-containing protein n=3 Tax=Clonostachys TaxID=110564 RepID=A0A9N9V2T8_9HYPO|nr:unnamed protein product [Clonostachys rosea f. rosea IK726]CAH0015986.1 unnamed protein product [Clonostachys rhizophaga]
MALGSLVNLILRLAQIAFAAIVAGVNGQILHESRGASSWALGRFIYTETIAGLSLFIPVIWVFLAGGHFSWVLDIIISLCWWAAFGLLVDNLNGSACGSAFNWSNVRLYGDDPCGKFKAVVAFAFLSAIVWLASAVFDLFWARRHRTTEPVTHHRRWHRSYV